MRGNERTIGIGGEDEWLNWPLLILIALIPLQNIYLGKLPTLGAGINALNVLMVFAFIAAASRRDTAYANPMNKYIFFLAMSYLLSLIVASFVLGWDEHKVFILKDMFFAYLFFFVTYKSITGMKSIKAIFWATIIPLPYMFRVFYTNMSWMGFSSYNDKLRFNSGTFLELGSNEIAAFYATYTFMALAFALVEQEKKRRWFLLACIGMNVYCLLYTFSRGAYLASMVGIVVLCWYFKKMKYLLAGVTIVFALLVVGVDVFPDAVTQRFNSSFAEEEELDDSAQKRKILWSIAMDKFEGNPAVGVGFNNFRRMNEYGLDTHNYYVKLLAEGGLVSFLSFATFLAACFRSGLQLLKKCSDETTLKLAGGFLACVSSLAVGNFFGDRFTHYPLISYLFVYLAIVIKLNEHLSLSKSERELVQEC